MKNIVMLIFFAYWIISCNTFFSPIQTPKISFDPIEKSNKGDLKLHTSIPYVNYFHLKPEGLDSIKSNVGFLGFSFGVDYFHQEKQHLNLTCNAVMDFPIPIVAPVDFYGDRQFMNSVFFNLTNNYHINNWSLGYGLNVSKNTWKLNHYGSDGYGEEQDEPLLPNQVISNWALGVTFPIYHQLTDRFHLGLIYRPTFIRFDTKPILSYEHLMSFDIAWKFNLYRKNN